MADSLVHALIDIITLKPVSPEANLTLTLSPSFEVSAESIDMATAIFLLAFVDVLAVGAISNVPTKADTAVAAQSVVAMCL